MTAHELASSPPTQLLDVRLEDDFEAGHLADAKNNCVFEVGFVDRLSETAPDQTALTVVYGANAQSHEAEAAKDKLVRQGYTQVQVLDGGLDAAAQAGLAIVQGAPLPGDPPIPAGTIPINTDESQVQWTGRNLLNKHWGTVDISQGSLTFTDGQLTSGTIRLNLASLVCTDLQHTELHDVLIAHLHNEDFFDVANHPGALLEITKTEAVGAPSPGAPNLRIEANLTLRGQTHPITFEATTGLTPEGRAAAQATFSIDRTRWGVLYGSGKYFHRLAGHLVNDLIDFEVKIVTQ